MQACEQEKIQLVKDLRSQGKSRAKIIAETGFPERFVRTHMEGVEKKATDSKTGQCVAILLTLGRVNVRQHELNDAVYNVYGNKWDGSKWVANWDRNTVQRVKEALIAKQPETIIVPNWVDMKAAEGSRVMLETMAIELQQHLSEMMGHFIAVHGSPDETKEAQQQANAAREHLLALAFGKYSPEPVGKLLARSKEVTDMLEYGESRPHTEVEMNTGKGERVIVEEREIVYTDHFCDEAERLATIGTPTVSAPAYKVVEDSETENWKIGDDCICKQWYCAACNSI